MRKFLLLLFFIPISLYAQIDITGKIISVENKSPIPDASVFLSNSKIGDKSRKDGSFTLRNIKNGRYDLVVSCVGYVPYTKTINVSDENITLNLIKLTEKIGELAEVKIKYESKSDRAKYIRLFTKAFLGDTYNATQCKIVNPNVLNFSYSKKTGKLFASTSEFLIIDNKALGYRIKYLVYSFMTDSESGLISYIGPSIFEPMTGNLLQEKIWQNNRSKAYKGSTMHFLRSCIANAVDENSFTVRAVISQEFRPTDSLIMRRISHFRNLPPIADMKDSILYWKKLYNDSLRYWEMIYYIPKSNKNTSIDRALMLPEFIKLTNEKGIYAFGHPLRVLSINYNNKVNVIDKRSSLVTFLEPNTFFDSNGVIFTPQNSLLEGYWITTRVANQLPVDYELPQEIEIKQAVTSNHNYK
ncbi:MAG: carboxypeptidase-like regulatory domain-containing protein [Bacteroidota bacterium]